MSQYACVDCNTIFHAEMMFGVGRCNVCRQTHAMLEQQQTLMAQQQAAARVVTPQYTHTYAEPYDPNIHYYGPTPGLLIPPLPKTPIRDFVRKILIGSILLFPFVCISVLLTLKTQPANIFVSGIGICIAWYYYRELLTKLFDL